MKYGILQQFGIITNHCATCAGPLSFDNYDRCKKCLDKCSEITAQFKPLPNWPKDHAHSASTLAATASNYRLRKMMTNYHKKTGHGSSLCEMVKFYKLNRDAVIQLRHHFGLYVGDDFWKLEKKHDESILSDISRTVYGMTSRKTIEKLTMI